MKTLLSRSLLLIAIPFVLSGSVAAQNKSPGESAGLLRRIPRDDEKKTKAPPAFELPLKWDERSNVRSVELENDSDKALVLYGVQSTNGIFVADFPSEIAPKSKGEISFVYQAPETTRSEVDIIRVLTSTGDIKELHIKLARPEVVKLSTQKLVWARGDSGTKTVDIVVSGGEVKPMAARAPKGVTTKLEFLKAGLCRLHVTPASTEEIASYPIFIDFSPELPGGSLVLTCAVEKR